MSYSAKIVLDSVAPSGVRLTTMECRYPRFIHSEMLTHRAFARNSASSRAIPFERMQQAVLTEPVEPLAWQVEAGGMQGAGELSAPLQELARLIWLKARDDALTHARALREISRMGFKIATGHGSRLIEEYDVPADLHRSLESFFTDVGAGLDLDAKLHKTMCNRIVEPWMWITVLITATDWQNFFRLRCHPDAEQHMHHIADMMRRVHGESRPQRLRKDEWHLPLTSMKELYCDLETAQGDDEVVAGCRMRTTPKSEICCRISVARCARVSYETHDGVRDWRKDLELYEKLCRGSGFGHWSPHEHVAQASVDYTLRSGPFRGWRQFRKTFANECAGEP